MMNLDLNKPLFDSRQMSAPRVIPFYSTKESYGLFSNFAKCPIVVDGVSWPTTEHYFQAKKYVNNKAYMDRIRQAKTPGDAARLGRSRSVALRHDWEDVKIQVMNDALKAKALQNKEFRDLLIGTGNAILVEHTVNDAYWGDGGNLALALAPNHNQLGQALIALRGTLLAEQQQNEAMATDPTTAAANTSSTMASNATIPSL